MRKFINYIGLSSNTKFFYNVENKTQEDIYLSYAKVNANAYVYKKYQIRAQIISMKCHYLKETNYYWDSDELSGMVTVTMKYEGQEFDVFISGKIITTAGYDNYQYEQLKADYCHHIESLIGAYPSVIILNFQEEKDVLPNMLSRYYYGNLEDYLEYLFVEGVMSYIDYESFVCIQEQRIFNQEKTNLLLVNIKNQVFYRKFCNKLYADRLGRFVDYVRYMMQYGCFYKACYLIEKDKCIYNEFEIQNYDDIYYMSFDHDLKTTTPLDAKVWVGGFPDHVQDLLIERCHAIEFGLTFHIESSKNERLSLFVPPNRLEGGLDVLHNEPAYFALVYKNDRQEYDVVEIHDIDYIYDRYHVNIWTKDCYLGMIKSKRK